MFFFKRRFWLYFIINMNIITIKVLLLLIRIVRLFWFISFKVFTNHFFISNDDSIHGSIYETYRSNCKLSILHFKLRFSPLLFNVSMNLISIKMCYFILVRVVRIFLCTNFKFVFQTTILSMVQYQYESYKDKNVSSSSYNIFMHKFRGFYCPFFIWNDDSIHSSISFVSFA